jgi:hypothetical protein
VETLSQATETRAGTTEQGALKTIHRDYNKLNGYESMLHIINRFRFVLYPFILLSIAGSSFSFFNDFMKAFPALGDTANLVIAIFFSIMLEIVRDGSLIALFNSKMRIPSRVLVVIIFLAVTAYLYSSHLQAIKVIEEVAIEYTLANQDEATVQKTNPKYEIASADLVELKKDLADKKAEKTPELMENVTSVHTRKREDALNRIDGIDAEIKSIKNEIKEKQSEIVGHKEGNIKTIEDSQSLISGILLATLLLVESLAMLGAVIKFINKDNANKEVAKHSEIIEEYESISEQMRKSNDELGLMLSHDIESAGNQNVAFMKAIANNRTMFQGQMNEIMEVMANTPTFSFNQPQVQGKEQYKEQPKERKIGFQAQSDSELLRALYEGVKKEDKLVSKSKVINPNVRREDEQIRGVYSKLQEVGAIEFKPSKGYYAKVDYSTAQSMLNNPTAKKYDFDLGDY